MNDMKEKHKISKKLFLEQLGLLLEKYDWNKELLKIAEEKCDFLHNYHLILFHEGLPQIIEEFEAWQDEKMLETLGQHEPQAKIRAKIAKALEIRIINILPKSVIFKQNALFLEPCNISLGLKCYTKTCDLIWRYAGDKSEDFNYYTKRGLLLGVYASARLFYLSDNTKDFVKTKEFIATSLDNIINIANIKNRIKFPKIEDIPILRLMS